MVSLGLLAAVFFFLIQPYQDADGNIKGAPAFAPYLVLLIVSLFVFAKQSGTVTWVLVAEIFPAKVRGTAMGLAVGALWIANAIVALVFPIMMEGLGGAGTYLIFCLINVLSPHLLHEVRARDEVPLPGGARGALREGVQLTHSVRGAEAVLSR